MLRPYDREDDDDLEDDHKPPSFQTVAAAIGRALGVCGRNSAGYLDRRQAKRQREQVGLELLQIAASVGLINPLKNPKAKRTGKGDKRADMQRVELSDEAQRDMAQLSRHGSRSQMTSAPIKFYSRRPQPVVDITPNWRGLDETPQCESPLVIDALDRAQRTGWRDLRADLGNRRSAAHDPVAEVKRAGAALKRARKTKSKPRIKRAKDDLRYWLTVVQAAALRGRTFYFKCRFDYRSRLYQVGSLLGYTGGDDLARARLGVRRRRESAPGRGHLLLSQHITSMFGHGESEEEPARSRGVRVGHTEGGPNALKDQAPTENALAVPGGGALVRAVQGAAARAYADRVRLHKLGAADLLRADA